jgi:hypothetical protein
MGCDARAYVRHPSDRTPPIRRGHAVQGTVSDTTAASPLDKSRRIEASTVRTETHLNTETKGMNDDH